MRVSVNILCAECKPVSPYYLSVLCRRQSDGMGILSDGVPQSAAAATATAAAVCSPPKKCSRVGMRYQAELPEVGSASVVDEIGAVKWEPSSVKSPVLQAYLENARKKLPFLGGKWQGSQGQPAGSRKRKRDDRDERKAGEPCEVQEREDLQECPLLQEVALNTLHLHGYDAVAAEEAWPEHKPWTTEEEGAFLRAMWAGEKKDFGRVSKASNLLHCCFNSFAIREGCGDMFCVFSSSVRRVCRKLLIITLFGGMGARSTRHGSVRAMRVTGQGQVCRRKQQSSWLCRATLERI